MPSTPQVFDQLTFSNVKVMSFSRYGGSSSAPFNSLNLADYVGDDPAAVRRNLDMVALLAGTPDVCVMSAIHGSKVNVVDCAGTAPSGDGLVTKKSDLALLALAADCVGFALVDPVSGVIAIGHAGWRGVLGDVMQSVVDSFVISGGALAQTKAVIGPAICGSCYEVPKERVSRFRAQCPSAAFDETHLDLRAGVRSVLAKQIEQIYEFPGCTQENENLFSYRKASGKPTGRGGLLVVRSSS